MNYLFNFFVANWDIILFVIVLLVVFVYLWIRGGKTVVFKMLYAMVTEAEKEYGNGTGALKLASVINKIYLKLPMAVRLFITADTLKKWVETVLQEAKKTWEQNNDIQNYIKSANDIVLTVENETEKQNE
jgi:hypothetical protein